MYPDQKQHLLVLIIEGFIRGREYYTDKVGVLKYASEAARMKVKDFLDEVANYEEKIPKGH